MIRLIYCEFKVFFRDWWFWLIQMIQPVCVVALIIYLFSNQVLTPQAIKAQHYSLLWVMNIWLQLSAMNLIWRNSFPLHAWQLSKYPLSLHALIRLLAFFISFSLPALFLTVLVLYGLKFNVVLFFQLLLVQMVCLCFSCILGYMLQLSNQLTGLSVLFLMPIFLPLNLIPAGANLLQNNILIEFSYYFISGVGCLSMVAFVLFFDCVLEKTV